MTNVENYKKEVIEKIKSLTTIGELDSDLKIIPLVCLKRDANLLKKYIEIHDLLSNFKKLHNKKLLDIKYVFHGCVNKLHSLEVSVNGKNLRMVVFNYDKSLPLKYNGNEYVVKPKGFIKILTKRLNKILSEIEFRKLKIPTESK